MSGLKIKDKLGFNKGERRLYLKFKSSPKWNPNKLKRKKLKKKEYSRNFKENQQTMWVNGTSSNPSNPETSLNE